MRTVLIVSPHFPPANAADMHRVRMVLPFLKERGWQAHVLAVNPSKLTVPMDNWMLEGLPADVPVHHADALGIEYSRIPGFGTIDLRCRAFLRHAGDKLLSTIKFDLIYFSTTVFGILTLGRRWERKYGVPFIVDYQDPWVSDFYKNNPKIVPPGGRIKYAIVDIISRIQEPRVLARCSGITSVSPAYPQQIQERYPSLKKLPSAVLPFPGSTLDLQRIQQDTTTQQIFDKDDGNQHWVYVGRGGNDMKSALSGFFHALNRWKSANPLEYQRTRIHFVRTSYAPSGQGVKTILPVAASFGVDEIVDEQTDRIPFSITLKCLAEANALIVPGSVDPAYTASKLYPYLLARKPLLTIIREESTVATIVRNAGGGRVVTFNDETSLEQLSGCIYEQWFEPVVYECVMPLDMTLFEPYTDRGSARQLCEFFDLVIDVAGAPANSAKVL